MVRGTAGSWPRISPAAFLRVWTFTYVRPDSSANRTEAFTVAFPLAPLLQGAQSGTITGPATPRRPLWMCAAIAFPVSRLNVSRHDMTADDPDFVTVAVKVPRARRTLPLGFGRSWLARIATFTLAMGVTCPRISPAGFVLVCTFA